MSTFFTDRKKLPSMNMSHFEHLPEFTKELEALRKKYRSLLEDLTRFESLVTISPTGVGKNFTITHSSPEVTIIKARLACQSLCERSMRIIYAYHGKTIEFVHIEIYFKGDKDNEDRGRIKRYIKSMR